MQGIERGGGAQVPPCSCQHSKRLACPAGQRSVSSLVAQDHQAAYQGELASLPALPEKYHTKVIQDFSEERPNLNKYRLSGVPLLLHQDGVHGVGPVPLLEPWSTKEKVGGLRSMVMSSSNSPMVVTVAPCYSSCWRVGSPLVVKHWCL